MHIDLFSPNSEHTKYIKSITDLIEIILPAETSFSTDAVYYFPIV